MDRRGVAVLRRSLEQLGSPGYTRDPQLLVIDGVGYFAPDPLLRNLLFPFICQRFQRQQPIALTSHKAFSNWGQVFADDDVLASAALNRLLHCSSILNIRGESDQEGRVAP